LEKGGVEIKLRHREERRIIPTQDILDIVKTDLKTLQEDISNKPIRIPPIG
jgi:hypothetical protein